MAVTLGQAKNYLKLDADLTDDDELITSLIVAARDYIRYTTGKTSAGEDDGLYDLCVKMLVAHWYENRTIYSAKPGAINDIPHSATALLIHIAQCGAYTGDAND